jgi:hypothetical protein
MEQMGSKILAGIERIHWETTSVLCFVGSTIACMRYLGEQVSNDYAMGISGGAFKTFWIPPWSPANCDLLDIGEEPVQRTFAALGYGYTFVQDYDHRDPAHTLAFYRDRIVESIDRGIPVMALGIVGPPECGVVAGYEQGGAVLRGWSYFQEDPRAYYRAEQWYDNCHGLILIGAKGPRPSPKEVLRASLEWALSLAHVPQRPAFISQGTPGSSWLFSGLAAYEAMAVALEHDEDFPADLDVLTSRTYALSNDGLYLLHGKRMAAVGFLQEMARQGLPAAEELRQAADVYQQEAAVVEVAARLTPWSGAPAAERLRLADAALRRDLARRVREAQAIEEHALRHVERALRALS